MTGGLATREEERLAALHELVPDPSRVPPTVDELVVRAATVARVPMATVNLLDRDFQLQPASAGVTGATTARSDAMCNVVLLERQAVWTPDARTDPRFADNPWVDGRTSTIRFYASFPLRTAGGHVIGTLCVFDTEVHRLDNGQLVQLQEIADEVVQALVAG